MPLYEYRCDTCRAVSTLLVYSWSADRQATCRKCGGSEMQRIMSGFSFRQSWGDSLNWVPSRETTSDIDEDSAASIDRYMGRIKHEMGGETTPDFEEMRREISSGPDD